MEVGRLQQAKTKVEENVPNRPSRHFTAAQRLALEELYSEHAELRFHGGAEGDLALLKDSHPSHFQDQTAVRVTNWFKDR